MVELTSLQQILSMSSGPEKVQQVQQQQPDVQGRQFAAEFREIADIQKSQIRETEPGNESYLVEDKKEPEGKRHPKDKRKKRKSAESDSPAPENIRSEEVKQGKIVDIVI